MRFISIIWVCFSVAGCDAYADTDPIIEIKGLDQRLEDNVKAHLSIYKEVCSSPAWEIEKRLEKSPSQIEAGLRALGYYHPVIRYNIAWPNECWQVSFDIEPGDPVLLNDVRVKISGQGAEQNFFVDVLANIPLQKSRVLNHSEYDAFKSGLISIAEDRGYFDHRFEKNELRVYPDRNQADILLDFNTGSRYFISEITIKQTILNPDFAEKYLKIEPGEPYDRSQLIKAYQQYDKSGYFSQINIKYPEKQAEDFQAPLIIELTAKPRHAMSFGVGYDTDLGIRGNADYDNRYVNAYGHRFDIKLSAAQRKSYIYLDYRIPLSDPVRNNFTFTAGYVYEDTDSVLSKTFIVGGRWSQIFFDEMLLTEHLNYMGENYNAGNGERRFSLLLVPRLTLSNIVAEKNGIFLDGYKYSLQIRGASRSVLSDVNFIQAQAFVKFSHSLFWGGRFIARADFGATAVDDFFDLPTTFRFYAGGESSIRAYKYKSQGPVNQAGEVIGGQHLAVASLEYEQQILPQWSLAAFIDSGNAFTSNFDIKTGFGVGVRWYSIVGPIRADVAFPVEDPGDVRFNFSFSTAL